MKKKILLASAAALVMAANVVAKDITPNQLKFQNLPLGEITSFWGTGANPTLPELSIPGSIIAGVAPPQAANLTEETISSALSIVNSEFGHMLLVKGKNAPASVTEGSASTGNLSAGWWNLIFIGPESEVGKVHRTTTQLKLISDVTPADNAVINFSYTSGQGMAIGQRKVAYAGDTGWFQAQIQGTLGAKDPARSVLGMGNIMDKSALYVYEIRVEVEAAGELEQTPNDEGNPGMDKPNGATVVGLDQFGDNSAFITWDNKNIYINDADAQNVAIYNIGGQLVSEFTADRNFIEVPMVKGVYVVKVGNKSTKVIL